MSRPTRLSQSPLALILALYAVWLTPGLAAALPTVEFRYGPAAPSVAEPVTFTSTGDCDVPPCRVQWRWFKDGGSHLGTSMGEGEVIEYAFTTAGTYSVVARITNATTTHGSASATHAVVVKDTYQDGDRRVRFGGWRGVSAAGASAGGHHVSNVPSGAAALSFAGTGITYTARTGPGSGVARLWVDGRALPGFDQYAAVPGARSRTILGLAPGQHRLVVRPAGTHRAASSGAAISVDQFVVRGVPIDDAAPRVTYAAWAGRRLAGADGGTVRAGYASGATAAITFTGTSLTWVTATGPDQGIARVVIDGTTVATVDNHSAVPASRVARSYARLAPGLHQARVVVLGRHNPASTSNQVVLDAFVAR